MKNDTPRLKRMQNGLSIDCIRLHFSSINRRKRGKTDNEKKRIGGKGMPKKITLPRDLVVWEEGL